MVRRPMLRTTIADTTVIGTGTATHVWLQTFNLLLSTLIGILTVLYVILRVYNEYNAAMERKKNGGL